MNIMHARRIELRERAREEVSLFLVIAFQRDTIAGFDQCFEGVDYAFCLEHAVVEPAFDTLQAPCLFQRTRVPLARCWGGAGLCGRIHAVTSVVSKISETKSALSLIAKWRDGGASLAAWLEPAFARRGENHKPVRRSRADDARPAFARLRCRGHAVRREWLRARRRTVP